MRDYRTLKTRLPILAISLTCGCAFNFGQVNASGTVNATADTKIDNKIDTKVDTTVNATASVATTSTPVATPTLGPGTLYVHYIPKMSGPGLYPITMAGGDKGGPITYFYLTASNERDQIPTYIPLVQSGDASTEKPLFVNLKIGMDGVLAQAIGETVNGLAEFKKDSGLFVIPAGKTVTVQVDSNFSFNYPILSAELFYGFFSGKTFGLDIKSPNSIRTLSGAIVEGDPVQGQLLHFLGDDGK